MSLIQTFEVNLQGNDYVVGDVHGHYNLLQHLLSKIQFNPKKDRLFILGDLGDRGPDSAKVVECLEQDGIYSIMANHEIMAIRSYRKMTDASELNSADSDIQRHCGHGGEWFYLLDDIQQKRIAQKFESLPWAIEIKILGSTVGLVHAEVVGNDWSRLRRELENHTLDSILERGLVLSSDDIEVKSLWSKHIIANLKGVFKGVQNIPMVCVGHAVVRDPLLLGNVLYLDTGAYLTGRLTAYCIQGPNAKQYFTT